MGFICKTVLSLTFVIFTILCTTSKIVLGQRENETETIVNKTGKPIQLLKCPGSNFDTDREYNISNLYFWYEHEDIEEDYYYSGLTARFQEGAPACSKKLQRISSQPLKWMEDTGITGHALYKHGWLLKFYNDKLSESISPDRFCVSKFSKSGDFVVQYCQSDCNNEPCVSKCCAADQICDLNASDWGCVCVDSGPVKWTSTVNSLSNNKNYSFLHHTIDWNTSCESEHFTVNEKSTNLAGNAYKKNEFKINANGTVNFRRKSDGIWIILEEKTYCVDGAVYSNNDSNHGEVSHFSGNPSDIVLWICTKSLVEINEVEKYEEFVLEIFVPFATVFIVLTVIVYILTWSEQNAHGYSVFFYLVTLLHLYIFIVLSNIPSVAHPRTKPISCGFIAAGIHFFYLSSTCWLTSVSFDMFWKFQKMNCTRVRSKGLRRFALYAMFSFGYPLAQVIVCAVLDSLYREVPKNELMFVIPDYGHNGVGCNMSNDGITFYLYIPISIFLACNIGFFIATIVIMKHYKKSIREAFAGIYNNANPKVNHSFGIYARLFIIMGICWITQIISWFVLLNLNGEQGSSYKSAKIIFFITDALTIFQSVVIFYIFVCKKNVFMNLWNLHPWLRPSLKILVRGRCCTLPNSEVRAMTSRPNSGQTNFTSFAGKFGLESRKTSNDRNSKDSDSPSKVRRTLSSEKDGNNGMRKTSVESTCPATEIATTAEASVVPNNNGRTSGEGKMKVIDETEETNV